MNDPKPPIDWEEAAKRLREVIPYDGAEFVREVIDMVEYQQAQIKLLRVKLDTHADINAENGNENIRLQKALDFYADKENWKAQVWKWATGVASPDRSKAEKDQGQIARGALQ